MTSEGTGSKWKRTMVWSVLLIFLLIIFLLSSQQGTESNNFSDRIYNLLKSQTPLKAIVPDIKAKFHFDRSYMFRKLAHFVEYFLLAVIVFTLCGLYSKVTKRCFVYSLFICVFLAFMDEYHQWFVPGRTSRIGDILIDVGGALLALCIAAVFRRSSGY